VISTSRPPSRRDPTLHRLGVAGLLTLAGLLFLAPTVAGASAARASLSGDTLRAQVSGGARVGVWRIRVVAPGRSERTDFVLRAGDLAWSGAVRTYQRTASGWVQTGRQRLVGTYDGLRAASGEGAGVRWHTSDFRLPRDGDGLFAISVELTDDGSYRVIGAVRSAAEAFSYGPWHRAGITQVAH
jgi:hypothetical protein